MAVFEGTFTQDPSSLRFAIVIGRFNDLVTGKLLSGCQDCLKRHGVDVDPNGTQVDYFWVPGSFEIPMLARKVAASHAYDAVICLGAVIRGQTPHFDYVSAEAAKGVAAASFQTGVPVIFGILTADTMQQALERAGIKSNHGWNYALDALEMANLMRQVNRQIPSPAYNSRGELNGEITSALPVSSESNAIAPESLEEVKEK
ncbi:6,7-dimethyl-8-ribityllumazine synthase [Hydrococcus rivularis NIES-593]|uniref:6,7-dimethyl-8-ribityllumazine synthase n=1 Tax=Hydrococcus rivularis NIES-593 TaxID=1921803 RepID=A0A1U7HMT5_9CYAN|nr:6,7-dimethyl-8-ribityllumazine synthase [Hydrococcus rivularis]OKH24910.1 6,7-dimethyl-8-ribityllumazine synthase [Hydrococcus rivularis NIES-593]